MASIRDPAIPVNLGSFRALQDEVRRLDALVAALRVVVKRSIKVDQHNFCTAEELYPELFKDSHA